MRRAGKIALWTFGGLVCVIAACFAFLQTGPGKAWVAATLTRSLSTPASSITVGNIQGLVPFDITVDRIALGDAGGPWLTIDRAALAWSPSALLHGRLRVDALTADAITVLRQPAPAQPSSSSSGLALPRLPVAVELRELQVGRLAIAPALAGGDNASASISAHGLLTTDRADLVVNLARTDGQPGAGLLDAKYDVAANALALKLDINEPTGILLDAAMARTDHLPLRVTLDGSGPLSGWQGQFHFLSGQGIHSDATIGIAAGHGSRVALKGGASITPLLAENLRPLIGETVTFDITAADDGKGGSSLASSHIALAAVQFDMQGSRTAQGALDGKLHIAVPDTGVANSLVGKPTTGAIAIDMTLGGTVDRPNMTVSETGGLTFGDIAVEGLKINAKANGKDGPAKDDPAFDLTVDATADALNDAATGMSYGALALHVAGTADAKGQSVDIRDLTANGSGIDLKGAGSFKNDIADGKATLTAADLSVIGKMFELPLAGAANLDIAVSTDRAKTITAKVTGKGDNLRTGTPAADALLAGGLTIDADGTRDAAGKVTLGSLVLATSRARIEGNGGFNPGDQAVNGTVTASLTDLKALSVAVKSPLAGSGKLTATAGGTLDAPTLDAQATVDRLVFGATKIDHFETTIQAPQGLNGAATAKGRIVSGKLNETIDAEFARDDPQTFRLSRLKLSGTGGSVDGALVAAPAAQRFSGKLTAAIGDLSVWSGVAGLPLAGKVDLSLNLPANGGQGPIKATIEHLALGASPHSTGVTHASINGTLSGDLARQSGTLDLVVAGISTNGGAVTGAEAHVAAKGKTTDFRFKANGRARDPFSIEMAGSATVQAGTNTLRLASLTAKTGKDTIALTKTATITVAPQAYRVTGLALSVDGGAIEGDAALSPKVASANIAIRQLPLHPLAFLAGKPAVGGTLDGQIKLSGTPQHPEAHVALSTKGLDVETDGPLPRPVLNLTADADWRGDKVGLDVKLASGSGESLALTGAVPFAFDLGTLQPRVVKNASLALAVKGGGKLENLTSIVPLGEDRVSGNFSIDVDVSGTTAAPHPSGRIAITGGHYANMALGTELDGIDLALTTSGERFVLDHLAATDGKSGKVGASGSVDLGKSPAAVEFNLNFSDFLVARGDDMTIDADGDLKLLGTLKAMGVSGGLKVRNAQIYIPDRLPASVVSLDVIEVGGRENGEAPKAEPVAPVSLQITLDAPGQLFVRGHGIVSEWNGHIDIGGTTAGPVLTGKLQVGNGSVDLLGQNFNIDRGIIRFDGSTTIDPVLDVQASATAGSVTAQVNVTGTANTPKLALSSNPTLPQDEILARVLFGSNVGSLTPSQGLQLAAAAAQLAQGGPGVMDRVRSAVGLDRLDLSSGGANQNGTQSQSKGTTVSGGKYIANGVFVGVAQGVGSNSSQATVEVEITPNISVNSTFGSASGSGFGAKYSVDY
ncbi:MAG TPA: translocation/assembly module TamB domain-containing protein [Alphaproteobacteria bacterium]|jgi:translocation and assembly module TamB|nr:translocation/assembly module TamB domain-containing protein [Alphaproteobacteria bacterium]